MDAAGDGFKKTAVTAERSPEAVDGADFRSTEKGSPPIEGPILPDQMDEASLNPQLLDQLNEQFAKQIQLAESEGMDDPFKIRIYNDWVNSLRSLNTELVQSLREMQDTCMERMALMRAAYLKDLVRFGPDIQLKRVENTTALTTTPAAGEEIISLELSSNYPIVPTTDQMLLQELDIKSRQIEELRKKLDDSCILVDQLRSMTKTRENQLDDKRKEINILRHQITALDDQLVKAKTNVNSHSIEENGQDPTKEACQVVSNCSFYSTETNASKEDTTLLTGHVSQPLLDGISTIQRHSETESEFVRTLKQELAELRAQLQDYKRVHGNHRPSLTMNDGSDWQCADMMKALLGLRGACEELLQTTGKFCGDEQELSGGSFRYEDDDELIEALRARCELLCRRLSEHQVCALEQDEGIGSTSISRLENCSEVQPNVEGHREQSVEADLYQEVVVQLKRLLGKDSINSASESLSSLSLGLDEGCTLQGLIDDLKKEIESKDLVLRDRHAELERLQQELGNRDRQLGLCRARQESIDDEKLTLQKKITALEETADDQGRIIAMLNMEKSKLGQQLEDLKETLHQYRDNLQKTSEEKIIIEDECKNQLVTISNLRVALEETKRNGSSSVSLFSGLRYSQPTSSSSHVAHRIGHQSIWPNSSSGKEHDADIFERTPTSSVHPQLLPQTTSISATTNSLAATTNSPPSGPANSNASASAATGSGNTGPTDYWTAIGRALFSGFDA